ncbi:hypothetical protein D3C85_1595470 [compost metagenome]
MIQVFRLLALGRLLCRELFGIRPWRKAAGTVLYFVQQAFYQIPVISRHPDQPPAPVSELAYIVVTDSVRSRSAEVLNSF